LPTWSTCWPACRSSCSSWSRALPGDPALIYAGEQNVTTERLERARKELGLDRPLPVQYLIYVRHLLHG